MKVYGLDLENRNIKLENVPGADHLAVGFTTDLTIGEAASIGDVFYFKSDGKLWKSDANAEATMPVKAMALEDGTAEASIEVLLQGFVRDDSWNWTTLGGLIYASGTTGALTQTPPAVSGDQVQIVGFATHADRMYFNPNYGLVEVA